MTSQVPDIQLQLVSETTASNYAIVASVAFLLYDCALAFGDEVQYIWQQKMSLGKALFLLNRYIPMVDLVMLMNSYVTPAVQRGQFCSLWFRVYTWIGVLSIVVVGTLLLLRTWALWGRSRTILISLIFLLVVCVLLATGPAIYISVTIFGIDIPSINSIRPCEDAVPKIRALNYSFASGIVLDSTIITLTLIKILPLRRFNGLSPLLTVLVRDGVLYFVIMFLMAVANVIMVNLAPPALSISLLPFNLALMSILGCRLVLNFRGSILGPATDDEDTNIRLRPFVFQNLSGDETMHHTNV